jgi:hypothetical protein
MKSQESIERLTQVQGGSMSKNFEYKLIVAVNAENMKKLAELNLVKPIPISKTTVHEKKREDGGVELDVAHGSVLTNSASDLKFLTFPFEQGMTLDEVIDAMKPDGVNEGLKNILKNSQHYSVFSITK